MGGLNEGESAWVGKPNWKRQPKMTNEAAQPFYILYFWVLRKCWWQWNALNIQEKYNFSVRQFSWNRTEQKMSQKKAIKEENNRIEERIKR